MWDDFFKKYEKGVDANDQGVLFDDIVDVFGDGEEEIDDSDANETSEYVDEYISDTEEKENERLVASGKKADFEFTPEMKKAAKEGWEKYLPAVLKLNLPWFTPRET